VLSATRCAGTETRVNAGNEANEYMVEVVEMAKSIGRPVRAQADSRHLSRCFRVSADA
jgi:hypothetical protein